jgi:23S rRNA (uracil1939-C5)-methyltransferase
VESDVRAVAALRENVAARALANVTATCGDAEAALAGARTDVVVLDPPRTGARAVCEALAARTPRRVVYVSCDAPTLGRDVGMLMHGMELVALDAFEMFPQTPHLEVVATLVRRRATAAQGRG